jgi:undecaprenyl-diphosphatase
MTDTTLVAPASSEVGDPPPAPRPARVRGTLSGVLLAIFVLYTFLVVTWWPLVHLDDLLNQNFHVHPWFSELHVMDRVGQRVLCLRPLVLVVMLAAWWHRTWRPVLLATFAVLMLNLLVGIVKLTLSRGDPLSGQSFFGDGDLYPSGHTSNIVLVYGLSVYLVNRYWVLPKWARRGMVGLVGFFALVQFTTSILLRWHWFSDLIGGCLIGGVVLALTAYVDAAIPARKRRRDGVRRPGAPHGRHRQPARQPDLVSFRRMPAGWPGAAAGRRSHR